MCVPSAIHRHQTRHQDGSPVKLLQASTSFKKRLGVRRPPCGPLVLPPHLMMQQSYLFHFHFAAQSQGARTCFETS